MNTDCLNASWLEDAIMTSPSSSAYGLPRYVANFLRHMEAHKDNLKWNITESSHKITLTLTWNFRKNKTGGGKETLWDKLQRTLKFSRSVDVADSHVPNDLTRYLETSPTKSVPKSPPRQPIATKTTPQRPPLQRQNTWSGPFRRPFNWSRYSSYSMPGTGRATTTPGTRNPFRHSQSMQESTSMAAASMSPAHLSFSGEVHNVDSMIEPRHSTPLNSTPNLSRSHSTTCSPANASRVRLTYRTTEELDHSMEDILEKSQQRTRVKLQSIRREGNRTIRDWPQALVTGMQTSASYEGALNVSTTDSETDHSLQGVNTTVQKVLRSCDNILAGCSGSTDV